MLFVLSALLAVASAAPADHQATSYSSFNDNHNSVHHADSAPAYPAKYAYPSAPVYAAPAVAPVYAAPAVAKVAVPAIAKVAIPAQHSYYSAPAVAKVAVPVAKVAYAAPVAKYVAAPAYHHQEEEYGPAKYEFAYAIQDPHTGDFHSQEEHRDGDHVVGQYSLHEADGTVRIVKYSDDGHGFNAVVERQGHPTEAPAVYKKVVAVAAPAYHH